MPFNSIRVVRMSRRREPEMRDERGEYQELPIDMWTLIDQSRKKVLFKGTTGPLVNELADLIREDILTAETKMELVYCTSGHPEGTRVLVGEFMEWAQKIAELIGWSREQYYSGAEA